MSFVTSTVLPAIKNRPKTIDARTHGIIDYCHAALFLTLGFICLKSNKRAAAAALSTGSLVLVQSLLTDYPLGVKPVFSFETHGRLDGGFASVSWLIPQLFGFSGTVPAIIFSSNTLLEGAVVSLTDFSSEHARKEEPEAAA
jgi:hypothetical protein